MGIYLIFILKFEGGRLVCHIQGMHKRKVPHGECLKLGVAGSLAALYLMIEHRKAGRELARAGTWTCHHYNRLVRRDVIVAAVAGIAHNRIQIVRIPLDRIVIEDGNARILDCLGERPRGRMAVKTRNGNAANGDAELPHRIDEIERLLLVRRPVIGAALLLLDIARINAKNELRLIAKTLKKPELNIGIISGKTARGVVIVHQLAAEFEIELAILRGALTNLLRLLADVFVVVKSKFHLIRHNSSQRFTISSIIF